MARFVEMSIDCDRILSFSVIPMLINPFIRSLRLNLANVLALITLDTKSEVDGVSGFTVDSVANFEAFLAGAVREETGGDYMVATLSVGPT